MKSFEERVKHILDNSLDLQAELVQVAVRNDGKVLWVNVEGVCALRICDIKHLTVEHYGHPMRDVTYDNRFENVWSCPKCRTKMNPVPDGMMCPKCKYVIT